MIWKIVLGLVVLFVLFVLWRISSVVRGARARDRALVERLAPLAQKLEGGAEVDGGEIEALAAAPELRPLLHALFTEAGVPDLFPSRYLADEAVAESLLVYWMLHPNELQAAPSEIELAERLERQVTGRQAGYYVFRYRMPPGHWAGSEWQLGVVGPFFADDTPYAGPAAGFARAGDRDGEVEPAELVDWYSELQTRRFGPDERAAEDQGTAERTPP